MGLTKVNGLLLKKMIIAGANELNANKQLVDSLNVFPVPDGDTGTNMSLTALAAAGEVEKSSSLSVSEISKLAANGSLRGARGNSGVILSQLFRGFSKGLEGIEEADTKQLSNAFIKGVETAYKAVMKPKEGTILTVARACADAAQSSAEIDETEDIEEFLKDIIQDGQIMLNKTKEMLPVLKQADVVDAGGKGFLFILEGAFKNIHHKGDIKVDKPLENKITDFSALASVENTSITFGYCTEFLINVKNAEDEVLNMLKKYLASIGDSIVVVGDDDVIKIHVHTDHPGLALEKGLSVGSLSGLKIDNMRQQHTNKIDFSDNASLKNNIEAASQKKETGFVAVSAGSGFSDIFKSLGVDIVIEGGQTMNPSTEDILNSFSNINAENIIVFPNNKNIILSAQQAAKLCENKKIYVIPTKTIPEGINAMINYRSDMNINDIIAEMNEGIKGVKTASVTYAVRKTTFDGKEIDEGDILGMIDDKIDIVSKDVEEGTKSLIGKFITDDVEFISIYYGNNITEEDAQKIKNFTEEKYKHCEVELKFGNQPLYYYIISAE